MVMVPFVVIFDPAPHTMFLLTSGLVISSLGHLSLFKISQFSESVLQIISSLSFFSPLVCDESRVFAPRDLQRRREGLPRSPKWKTRSRTVNVWEVQAHKMHSQHGALQERDGVPLLQDVRRLAVTEGGGVEAKLQSYDRPIVFHSSVDPPDYSNFIYLVL